MERRLDLDQLLPDRSTSVQTFAHGIQTLFHRFLDLFSLRQHLHHPTEVGSELMALVSLSPSGARRRGARSVRILDRQLVLLLLLLQLLLTSVHRCAGGGGHVTVWVSGGQELLRLTLTLVLDHVAITCRRLPRGAFDADRNRIPG